MMTLVLQAFLILGFQSQMRKVLNHSAWEIVQQLAAVDGLDQVLMEIKLKNSKLSQIQQLEVCLT